MKILIISYYYFPDINPRSIRWTSLVKDLVSNGNKVTVITASEAISADMPEKIINVSQNFIGRLRGSLSNVNIDAAENKGCSGFFRKVVRQLYFILVKNFLWPDFAWTWIFPARRESIKEVLIERDYDVLISVSHPFSSHLVARKLKKKFPNMKWIIDIGDPFYFMKEAPLNNFFLYSILNKYIEKKIFYESDHISVTTPETKERYIQSFNDFKNKIKVIPPMVADECVSNFSKIKNAQEDSSEINLLFVGTLYSQIRNPSRFIYLLSEASYKSQQKINMNFYGTYNGIDTTKFKSSRNFAINFYDEISRERVFEEIKKSDVLVNFGNSTEYQLPSKVVEYSFSKKVILNIITANEDSSKRFLRNYSRSKTINLNNQDSRESINEIIDFFESLEDMKFADIDFDFDKYKTPAIVKLYTRFF